MSRACTCPRVRKESRVGAMTLRSRSGEGASAFRFIWAASGSGKVTQTLLKGGEYPEEGDDEDTEGLSDTENERLQRDHRLPGCFVHTCYGCTGEDPSTHWSQNAHEQDGDGHEAGHLVLSQHGEGQQSCRQVEDQGGDRRPHEHTVPHLWEVSERSVVSSQCAISPRYQIEAELR